MSDEGPSFEDGLRELEGIVERLERGELSLEGSVTAFERGRSLLERLTRELDRAEQRVRVLVEREGESLEEAPFRPEGP